MKEIHNFTIIRREQLGQHYFRLVLKHGGKMQPVAPGQFVEVQVEGCREVMLRRPISVHDVDQEAGTMSLLVQIVGNGTRRLAELKVGEKLNVVYPLGHGFSVEFGERNLESGVIAAAPRELRTPNYELRTLLVGGGAGIAPLLHLSKVLGTKGIRPTILLGGRTADLIPVREDFKPYGELCIATDDGSLGHKGLVISHPAFSEHYDMIYTCGPTPMMKAVARSAAERGIRCEVSLENMMACGVGACLCCVTDTDEGHRCVCKDGPVFDATKLKNFHENN